MCEITGISVPAQTTDLFDLFKNDCLADVLRVWDCYSQDWHDTSITLFRFENDDVLVWDEKGLIQATSGPIDTNAVNINQLRIEDTLDDDHLCLCWRCVPEFSSFIGQSDCTAELLAALFRF